jgi:hypothetical protein
MSFIGDTVILNTKEMNMEREFFICQNCLKDTHLKKYCKNKGGLNDICIVCEKQDKGIKIDKESKNEISNLFKSCLRFNHREIEYNPNLDGKGLFEFFCNENSLLNHQYKNYNSFHSLISSLFKNYNQNDVKIFYGKFIDNNEEYDSHFEVTLKNGFSEIWYELKKRLKRENYYNIKPDLLQPLSEIIEKTKIKIRKNCRFFRARIGNDYINESKFTSLIKKPVPFQGVNISAPPPLLSSAGRLNREGVSYLYLSSKSTTAIAEIRPNPGDIVSVGEFKCLKTISLIDLRKVNLLKFIYSQKEIELFSFALSLSKEFMKPRTNKNSFHYLITQFVAETFRELNQDGIIYNSAVSNGYNITLFNPSLFEFVPESSSLHRVNKVSFKSTEIKFTKNEIGFYVEKEI